ncbi:MAG: DUF4286 family protein [Saprospiraceae bacterium]
MIIYSVTIQIDPDVERDWLSWMKNVHIPEVMATGCFVENRFCQLIEPIVDPDMGTTYNIQYSCQDQAAFDQYQSQYAPALQQDHRERYEGYFVVFRTVLEQLN